VKKSPGGKEEKREFSWFNNVPVKLGKVAIMTNLVEGAVTITKKKS
jgi:hypothetical protein